MVRNGESNPVRDSSRSIPGQKFSVRDDERRSLAVISARSRRKGEATLKRLIYRVVDARLGRRLTFLRALRGATPRLDTREIYTAVSNSLFLRRNKPIVSLIFSSRASVPRRNGHRGLAEITESGGSSCSL